MMQSAAARRGNRPVAEGPVCTRGNIACKLPAGLLAGFVALWYAAPAPRRFQRRLPCAVGV